MENKFVDHLFSKIIEGRHEKSLSAAAAKSKLEQLESVAEQIRTNSGSDAVQNVLGYCEVKRALEQCHRYIIGEASITDTDFSIYYSFAADRLREAEAIIDNELSHLGL